MKSKTVLWAGVAVLAIIAAIMAGMWARNQNHTFVSIDRSEFYSSLDELVAASPQIFVGKVTASNGAHDDQLKMDVTQATVELYKVSDPAAETASTAVFREIGTPKLEVGKVYVIFAIKDSSKANPSGAYDIRGVNAGIYVADSSITSANQALAPSVTYSQVFKDELDNLPATIRLADLPGF